MESLFAIHASIHPFTVNCSTWWGRQPPGERQEYSLDRSQGQTHVQTSLKHIFISFNLMLQRCDNASFC